MKGITFSAVLLGLAARGWSGGQCAESSSGCGGATPLARRRPAVASAYLRDQVSAGKKLTMSRAAIIADVTKNTGPDGEFAGSQAVRSRIWQCGALLSGRSAQGRHEQQHAVVTITDGAGAAAQSARAMTWSSSTRSPK